MRETAFFGTVIEYFPLTSEAVPIVVPLTCTVTPGITPSFCTEDVTVPVMVLVCARSGNKPVTDKTMNRINFFISFRLVNILLIS